MCGLAGLGSGRTELDGVGLLITVNLELAPNHGKFSGLGCACLALRRVGEEGVEVELAKFTVLPGEGESRGEGDGVLRIEILMTHASDGKLRVLRLHCIHRELLYC